MNTKLTQQFELFHKQNPEVYRLFCMYTFAAIRSGREHYSANAIFERIRWHVDIETESPEKFKLNNNHRAYYARLFHKDHPRYGKFFRNRALRESSSTVCWFDTEERISRRPCGRCGKEVKGDWPYDWCKECSESGTCRHGERPENCEECFTESDLAFDASRESR